MIRRPLLVTALAACALVGVSGCVPDELLVEPTRTPTTEPTPDPPPASLRTATDDPDEDADEATDDADDADVIPSATDPATDSGAGEATGRATHTPSAAATPTPTYTPPIICPHVIALDPQFEVTPAGVDETTGYDLVEVVMTYTNPVDYPLWLRGSIGYLDSENAEGDLYSLEPGDIAFEDIELPPGEGKLTGTFEDVWGEVMESELYFTAWTISGLMADVTGAAPCETNRGYTNH